MIELEGIYKRVEISPTTGGQWVLLKPFTYYVGGHLLADYTKAEEKIEVEAGFVFDGASIPSFFWFIAYPFDTEVIIAALVHDYIFRKLKDKYTLYRSDEIFNEIMELCKTRKRKRFLIYRGLRFGSWVARYFTGENSIYSQYKDKKEFWKDFFNI